MMHLYRVLMSYWRARRLRFACRTQLEQHQARQLTKFLPALSARSPYFSRFQGQALAAWPTMDKTLMVAHFDTMNTAGLKFEQAVAVAQRAESSRDFNPTIGDITVGLSSGTSAQRCVFAVSPSERAQWAGVVLAKALPNGLLTRERVALLLRANSTLYTSVRTPWLSFTFFDLFQPFEKACTELQAYAPTVIVAPAQVLRQLACKVLAGELALQPKRVISTAEVLEPQDRAILLQAFGNDALHEIYQATEGFIACTCEHGVLHLNEEFLHVEPQWLDDSHTRFMPIITDFTRITQPIVRYRLDDVLVLRHTPCRCGRATQALERIEGRVNDVLILPGTEGLAIHAFGDALTRAFAQALPLQEDYLLLQTSACELVLHARLGTQALNQLRDHLCDCLAGLGVATAALQWRLVPHVPEHSPAVKRRRIQRVATAGALQP